MTTHVSTTTNDIAGSYRHEGHENRNIVHEDTVDQSVEKPTRNLDDIGDKSGMVQGYT
jgi:hypothetical protein